MTATVTLIGARDGQRRLDAPLSETLETHVIREILHRAILTSIVHDAIHGMARPRPAQRTRMPLQSVRAPRTALVASAEAVGPLQAVVETSTSTTGTDTMILVTVSQTVPIDRAAAHHRDAGSGIHGTSETLTGGTVMTEGLSRVNMIPTLDRQALQSRDSGHWTHTAAQALLTCAIFQVLQQVQLRIPYIMPLHRTG